MKVIQEVNCIDWIITRKQFSVGMSDIDQGVAHHYMDRRTHYHSAQLRALGKTSPVMTADSEELHEAAANALDSLHRSLHKNGVGRIVAMSLEEMRAKALEVSDAAAKASPNGAGGLST